MTIIAIFSIFRRRHLKRKAAAPTAAWEKSELEAPRQSTLKAELPTTDQEISRKDYIPKELQELQAPLDGREAERAELPLTG